MNAPQRSLSAQHLLSCKNTFRNLRRVFEETLSVSGYLLETLFIQISTTKQCFEYVSLARNYCLHGRTSKNHNSFYMEMAHRNGKWLIEWNITLWFINFAKRTWAGRKFKENETPQVWGSRCWLQKWEEHRARPITIHFAKGMGAQLYILLIGVYSERNLTPPPPSLMVRCPFCSLHFKPELASERNLTPPPPSLMVRCPFCSLHFKPELASLHKSALLEETVINAFLF